MASHSSIIAPPHIHTLLYHLHSFSTAQELLIPPRKIYRTDPNKTDGTLTAESQALFDLGMKDKLIALDQDKCQFIYNLIRTMGATNVIEAGTGFGVSTIYLALAVGQNVEHLGRGKEAKVIGTEMEKDKAERARGHWEECGEVVTKYVELREGDLLETLKKDLPVVDLLLLDIWTPLALPTLKLVQPSLRPGAVVIADNTAGFAANYEDLLTYLREDGSGFTSITLPFSKGLEFSVYLPSG